MVLAEGSTPEEAVSLSLITRPLREGGRGGVDSALLDWDFRPGRTHTHTHTENSVYKIHSFDTLDRPHSIQVDICFGIH